MSIFKPRGSNAWYYDFRRGGRRFSGTTSQTEKRSAKRVEDEVKRSAEADLRNPGLHKDMTLNVAAARFYTEVAQHQATADTVDYQLENLINGLGKGTLLSNAGAGLSTYIAKRRADVSNASVNREIQLLRRVLRRADRAWKVAVDNPDWRELLLPEPQGRSRELSRQEETALFEHLRQDYHPIVRFLIHSGLRAGNAMSLTWPQIDFEGGELRVRLKSKLPGGRIHTLPLSPALLAILSTERDKHPHYVFTYKAVKTAGGNLRGNRYPITKAGLRRATGTAFRKAGIEDFRIHDFRHTAGTRMLRSSDNLRLTQRLLGHKDISTTVRYAHVTDRDLMNAMRRMDSQGFPKVRKGKRV